MAQINFGLLNTNAPAEIGATVGNAFALRKQRIQQDEDRAFQREGMQMQNALARMGMQKAQREAEVDEELRNVFARNGSLEAAIPEVMKIDPQRGMAYQKQMFEQKKGAADMDKTRADLTMKRLDMLDRVAGRFAATPTREAAVAGLQQLRMLDVPDDMLAQTKAQIDATPDEQLPALAQQFLAQTQEGIKAQTERLFPKPAAQSDLSRLMAERDALPQGDPRRAMYDQALRKQTTHAPAAVTNVSMALEREEQKEKGKSNVALYGDVRNSASVARKLNGQLESQARVLDKGFDTGFGTETKAAAASVLGALGVEGAENFATNAQTFGAAAKEVVLQKQLAQKGPQTESDAKRIEQTGTQLGNTPAANRFILDVARTQNDKDIAQQQFFDSYWRKNGTYEGAEAAWYEGDGGKSLFDSPRMKKYEARQQPGGTARAPQAGTVESGYRFKGGNPADKNNWEKVR